MGGFRLMLTVFFDIYFYFVNYWDTANKGKTKKFGIVKKIMAKVLLGLKRA